MEYTYIGNTNIKISKLCLGCMSFGDNNSGHHAWTLNEKESEKIIVKAYENGINFFDTANCYSNGTSEKFLGKAIKKNISRDKVVIASKVYKNDGKLSKEAINREIDKTLINLQTDYLDLYVIHRFDYDTPMFETLSALDNLVKCGKIRAYGASSMYGYQFHNYQILAKENGMAGFQTMQNHYNLLYREDERELLPICKQYDVTITPHSVLAAGRLARNSWNVETLRSKSDDTAKRKYDRTINEDKEITKRVEELSKKYHTSMSNISLAWLYEKGVSSPIIGVTKEKYFDDYKDLFDIKLTNEDINYLQEPYIAHNLFGPV